jgi:hypothetical protein
MWKSLEKFCGEVFDSSFDNESDKMMRAMAHAASIVHEHNSQQDVGVPGLCEEPLKKPAAPESVGTSGSTRTTSTAPIRCSRKIVPVAVLDVKGLIRLQRTYNF